MKKLFALILAVVMCFCLVACSGGETENNNDITPESTVTSEQADVDSTPDTIIASLDTEYLTGTWVWIENRSSGLTSIRSFELCADGTGTILTSSNEGYESATFTWEIEDEMVKWEKVSAQGFGTYILELSGNNLTDITWSDFFAKETK